MALTATTMINQPSCLLVAYVDEAEADGAIGRVEVTNRKETRPITVYAIYQGQRVERVIQPGPMVTITFRGQQPRAGDVSEIGYY